MAREVKTKKPAKTAILQKEEKITVKSLKQSLFEQLRLSESYVSLILGAVVVLVLSLVFFIFVKGNNSSKDTFPAADSLTPFVTKAVEQTYTLHQDETLWDVAVKFYGDGFKWVDIAKANKLEDTADYVPPGTKLIIPNAK